MSNLEELLSASAAVHRHLCPRQVLGVRMGLLSGQLLGLDLPRSDKRLLVFVETDGCVVDGVSVATGCYIGHRTLRVLDFGKVAATFVDVSTGKSLRVAPRAGIRDRAVEYAPHEQSRWHTQLLGYQRMPDGELLCAREVRLAFSLEKLLSKPGRRATCAICGEEILNEREVIRNGATLCRTCAGESYYLTV
jgi:formylmethanofuran dehydrogenase subunit E